MKWSYRHCMGEHVIRYERSELNRLVGYVIDHMLAKLCHEGIEGPQTWWVDVPASISDHPIDHLRCVHVEVVA